ncbi:MAG: alcohol dehydrogenase catalytic domain-containing protein [Ignavibacteria bacterium]|jgi:L-iditol 2-dehydrogenase
MKAVKLQSLGKLGVYDITKPKLTSSDNAIIKIKSVGVCGSDIHYFREGKIGDQKITFPFTIGHEASGYIEEITGDDKFAKGQLVTMDPAVSCGKCDQCLSGREHTCRSLKFIGAPGQLEGMMCEYIEIPKKNLFPVPADFTEEDACFIEPLSIGVYSVKLAGLKEEKTFGVLGAGPIGLSVIMSLIYDNHKNIYVTEKLNYREEIAKEFGAVWTGNPDEQNIIEDINSEVNPGLDVVFECCGDQQALNDAVDILKPGGKVVIVGIPSDDFISFDISTLRRKEITIVNVRRQNKSMERAIDIYKSFKKKKKSLLTHSFPFTESQEAFDIVNNYEDGVIKAVINF